MLHLNFCYEKTCLEWAKFRQAYFSQLNQLQNMLKFFPKVPKKSHIYHLPISLVFSPLPSPSHYSHLFYGPSSPFPGRLAWEQQSPPFLPAPPPGRRLCICPHEAGVHEESCTRGRWAWECTGAVHTGARARSAGVCMSKHAWGVGTHGADARRIPPGRGSQSGLGARSEPSTPVPLSYWITGCWSRLSPVRQSRPSTGRMSSHLRREGYALPMFSVFTFQLMLIVFRIQFGWKQ